MQSNQLPPLQQNSSPFSRPPLTTPINNQQSLEKPLSDLPPLPPLAQNSPNLTVPINPNPSIEKPNIVVEKRSTNWLLIIAVAVIFFAIGMGVAYLIFINRGSGQSKIENDVTPTDAVEQTTTPITPTASDLRYTSDDLKISFILPQGVKVTEVDAPYNPEGCILPDVSDYPTYKAINVYYNDKELMTIGIDDYCDTAPITEETPGASVLYEFPIENTTYKLLQLLDADQYGFMRTPIEFGENSEVATDDANTGFAVMRAQVGDAFTKDEFEMAVLMIASISPQ